MSKKIAELTCPECKKEITVPFDVTDPPTLEEISASLQEALKGNLTADQVGQVISEQLESLKPPAEDKEDHKHKTADDFFDCPECLTWVEKTGQRYQVSPKEPEKPPEHPEQEPAPIGSIFSTKKEGD